jgi:hypothetical protein
VREMVLRGVYSFILPHHKRPPPNRSENQDLCQKADSTVRNYVQLQWHQVLYRCSPPSCTKSIKRCANPSYQNRLVKALDFGGVFRYTYLYEKVTPVEVSLRVLPLIS